MAVAMGGLGRANLGDAATDNGWGNQSPTFIAAYNAAYAENPDDGQASARAQQADDAASRGPGGTTQPPNATAQTSTSGVIATDTGLFLKSLFNIQATPPANMTVAQQQAWAALNQTPWYRTTTGIIGILAVVGIGAYLFMGKSHHDSAPVGGHRIRRKR